MKFLLHPVQLWMILFLELVMAPSVLSRSIVPLPSLSSHFQVSDQLPPRPKNPSSTVGGGTRGGGKCSQDAETSDPPLTALLPITQPRLTLAAHPTFLVYVPQTAARIAEFSLFGRNNRGIYQTTFALGRTPNIVSFSLPATAPSLKIGEDYQWFFTLICMPQDRLQDQFVTGSVRRIQLNPASLGKLEKAAPKERINLYAANGIWYEALSTLLMLRRSQPNDPNLIAAWQRLLHTVGLDAIAAQPLRKL